MEHSSPIHDKEAAWAAFHAYREYDGGRAPISSEVRLSVFEAANWRCCYCGIRLWSNMSLARESHALFANEARMFVRNGRAMKSREATIEHIRKQIDGGGHERDNLAAACAWCNSSRGEWDARGWFAEVTRLKDSGQHPHFKKGG